MLEREVKIRVSSHEALVPRLEQIGAEYLGREQEVNRILDTPGGTLFHQGWILRVRTTPAGVLTWKAPVPDPDGSGHKMRQELEVHVGAPEVETLLQILGHLGFREVLRYDKQRDTWRWQGAVIQLDTLDFGLFVEIEGEGVDIEAALPLLGLQDMDREHRSYSELQRLHQQQAGS